MIWQGVFSAVTTPFTADLAVDHDFLAKHLERMLAGGVKAFVLLGSLGVGATLTFEEKAAILETAVQALQGRVSIVAGIPALATREAEVLAQAHPNLKAVKESSGDPHVDPAVPSSEAADDMNGALTLRGSRSAS